MLTQDWMVSTRLPLQNAGDSERGLDGFCFLSSLVPSEVSERFQADGADTRMMANYPRNEYEPFFSQAMEERIDA